jgi:hypothetical protein
MSERYYQFSKKHFEYELRGLLIKNKAGFLNDVTEEIDKESEFDIWEHVYSITTKNKSVDILVFSSVSRKTGKVRDKGSDAVRLVLRWKTRNGNVYKSLGKHYRIKTLFKNLEKTILETQEKVFDLNWDNFNSKFNKDVI